MTQVRDALEACPFCGSKMVAQGATAQKTISVWCMKCGTRGPDVPFPDFCEPVAQIELCHQRWNTRASAASGEPCAPQPAAGWDEDYPYDDERFNKGVQHVVDLIARELGVTDWVTGDGSEDYDSDLWQTILNILAAKGLYDSEEAGFASFRREAPTPAERTVSARPDTAEARLREALDLETIQTLLDLLNPLHGSLDEQTYDDKLRENFDAPADAEYGVNITARMERDLTQAVLILEDRKRQALSPPSGGDEAKESEGEGKVDSPTALADKGQPRIHAHGVATVGTIAANMDSIGVSPSEPSPPADRREIVARIKRMADVMRSAHAQGVPMPIWTDDLRAIEDALAALAQSEEKK